MDLSNMAFTNIRVKESLNDSKEYTDDGLSTKANTVSMLKKLISRTILDGESVSAMTWTKDDNESDLSLQEAEIRIYVPSNSISVGTSGFVFFRVNDVATGYITNDSDNATSSYGGVFRALYGLGVTTIKRVGNGLSIDTYYKYSDGTSRSYGFRGGYLVSGVSAVNKLYITISGLSTFPVGTCVEIYGRSE